jgi:hypothetical protein
MILQELLTTEELKYIIKFLLIFFMTAVSLYAQEGEPQVPQDTIIAEVDTLRTPVFQDNRSASLI